MVSGRGCRHPGRKAGLPGSPAIVAACGTKPLNGTAGNRQLKSGGTITRSLASIFLFLVFSSFLVAQQDLQNNCDLRVRVRTDDDRRIEEPIQVAVLSTRGLVATVNVVGEEYAQTRVTSGRSYRLTVSGSGIESITTSYFDIGDLEREHTETVHVKPKNSQHSEESPAGTGTISISEMDIPKKASVEMKKGLDAYSKGDMKTAASHFETATADYPRYARAFDMLGAIAMKGSDRAKARDLFSKSIEADVTFSPAYVDLARLDLQDKRYAESESLLAKAISFHPSRPMPWPCSPLLSSRTRNTKRLWPTCSVPTLCVITNNSRKCTSWQAGC